MSRRESGNSTTSLGTQNKMFGMPSRYGSTPTHSPGATPAPSGPPTPGGPSAATSSSVRNANNNSRDNDRNQGLSAAKKKVSIDSTAASYLPVGVETNAPPPYRPTKDGGYGVDSNISDMIARRGKDAPSLEYLQFGAATTHGQSFNYSAEMLDALGQKKDGSRPRGPNDMESPWAIAPTELHEPGKSLYGKDFEGKQAPPVHPGGESGRAAELAERNQQLKAEVARKREEGRSVLLGGRRTSDGQLSSPSSGATKASPVPDTGDVPGMIKRFDHYGVYRRAASTPLQHQINLVNEHTSKHRKMNARPAQAIPDICNPLLGGESIFAWNPNSVAASAQEQQSQEAESRKNSTVSTSTSAKKKSAPTAFWYPKDRQLKKHQRLENQRWDESGANLQVNGWDTETIVGTREKKVSNPEFQTSLSAKDQAKVNAQLDEYRIEMEEKKQQKKERQKEVVALEKAKAMAHAQKKHNLRNSRSVLGGLGGLRGQEFSTTTGDYGARDDESDDDNGRGTSSFAPGNQTPTATEINSSGLSPQQIRGELHVPDAAFRAELPGARLPTGTEKEKLMTQVAQQQRLTMPPVRRSKKNDAGQEEEVDASPAPPWGRPTAQDERYAKVKVYSTRNKQMKISTTGKRDVDRELRVVRDGGLQKKAKASLLKTVDPEQLKYIKQMGNHAMRQTRNPPSVM